MVKKTEVMGVSSARGAWLYVAAGAQTGRDFRLGRQVTIGRSTTECDVILSDSKVSERHARIKMDGNEYVLYDLASLNGTLVNGKPVQKQVLADDDEITIGDTRLVFKVTPKPPVR